MTNARKRPLAVTIIGVLYVITGIGGMIVHAPGFHGHAVDLGGFAIESVSLLAIVAGIFLLRGANWARWLALAWMAFHVYVGALHGWTMAATHAAFLVAIAIFLLKKPESEYFTSQTV
jgi:hypothetical protein